MSGVNSKNARGGKQKTSAPGAWPVERWVAVLVLGSLFLLILIRMGFRGVNVGGFSASVN